MGRQTGVRPIKPFTVEIRKSKMARRRKKPTDPAEIARKAALALRDPSKWGFNEDAMKLPTADDVQLDRVSRANEKRAVRFDIFARFYRDGSLERRGLEAVRRLQDDIAILHRSAGVSGSGIITPLKADDEEAMILAGQRIETVKQFTGAHSWAILLALCEKEIKGETREWWAMVQAVTREANRNAQGALVRAAAMNLADAYTTVESKPRRAA